MPNLRIPCEHPGCTKTIGLTYHTKCPEHRDGKTCKWSMMKCDRQRIKGSTYCRSHTLEMKQRAQMGDL